MYVYIYVYVFVMMHTCVYVYVCVCECVQVRRQLVGILSFHLVGPRASGLAADTFIF